MDIPYDPIAFPTGASALLSAVSFHHADTPEIQLLQFQKIQESIPVQRLSIVASGKREISRQRWEEMKPLIQRAYIMENKTFRQLRNILRAEYGVEPTYGSLPYCLVQTSFYLRGL
jgi:hypothetical protein